MNMILWGSKKKIKFEFFFEADFFLMKKKHTQIFF